MFHCHHVENFVQAADLENMSIGLKDAGTVLSSILSLEMHDFAVGGRHGRAINNDINIW